LKIFHPTMRTAEKEEPLPGKGNQQIGQKAVREVYYAKLAIASSKKGETCWPKRSAFEKEAIRRFFNRQDKPLEKKKIRKKRTIALKGNRNVIVLSFRNCASQKSNGRCRRRKHERKEGWGKAMRSKGAIRCKGGPGKPSSKKTSIGKGGGTKRTALPSIRASQKKK